MIEWADITFPPINLYNLPILNSVKPIKGDIMNPSVRAEIITKRTYNRPLNQNTEDQETFEQTIARVKRHQKWLWERALTHKIHRELKLKDVTEDLSDWVSLDEKGQKELDELEQLMLERKALPSGRTLWLGGTDIAKRRESSQFNCSFTNVETVYDVVDCFWLLLQGYTKS